MLTTVNFTGSLVTFKSDWLQKQTENEKLEIVIEDF